MERFIFNQDYFNKDYMYDKNYMKKRPSQAKKLSEIAINAHVSEETLKNKLLRKKSCRSHRPIKENDYNYLKEADKKLVLDTERLIEKLFLRVNLDLSPNQKYVLYLMLCMYDEGDKCVSIDDLRARMKDKRAKQNLTENFLNQCEIIIDKSGTKDKLFISEGDKFSINMTALILFTDTELE